MFGCLDFGMFGFLDFKFLDFGNIGFLEFLSSLILAFWGVIFFDLCSVFLLFCVLCVCCAWLLVYICSV